MIFILSFSEFPVNASYKLPEEKAFSYYENTGLIVLCNILWGRTISSGSVPRKLVLGQISLSRVKNHSAILFDHLNSKDHLHKDNWGKDRVIRVVIV